MALSWLLALCVVLLLLYLGYRSIYVPYQLFRNLGIKGPSPLPMVGNFHTWYKMGYLKYMEHLTKEYGHVVGFYLGTMPMLKVTDVDMLKQILVKDFDCFMNRPYFPDLRREANAPQGLVFAQGEEWRTARHTLSPTFSAAKMKAMVPLIMDSVDTLVKVMDKCADSEKSVDVFVLYGRFTLETIMATAFGRIVDLQHGESDEFVRAAHELFRADNEGNSISTIIQVPLIVSFPWLEGPLRYLVRKTKIAKDIQMMVSVSKQLIQQRREIANPQKYKDLLQLMIDVNYMPDGEGSAQQKLTDEQIVTHAATFMLVGSETTSTTLTYVTYLLALNPTVQEKLQREIEDYFENNPDTPLYDATHEIEYLDKVVQEALRIYAPGGAMVRHCQKTVTINGVTIPKGVTVTTPFHILHRDPAYWNDPEFFNPERFTSEEKAKRPPISHCPFGYGPRNCIGMRLALLEAKLALIQLLRKYTFVQTSETEVPLELDLGLSTAPKHGVFVKVVKNN